MLQSFSLNAEQSNKTSDRKKFPFWGMDVPTVSIYVFVDLNPSVLKETNCGIVI